MEPKCPSIDRWNTYVVDGRDVEALCQVFWKAAQVKGKPTAVVAKTFRGRGMPSKYFFPVAYLKHLSLSLQPRRQKSVDRQAGH